MRSWDCQPCDLFLPSEVQTHDLIASSQHLPENVLEDAAVKDGASRVGNQADNSGEGETAAGHGNWAAEFLGGFDPLPDNDFDVGERFLVGFSIGSAAWKLRNFGDKGFVCRTPINDDLVFSHRKR